MGKKADYNYRKIITPGSLAANPRLKGEEDMPKDNVENQKETAESGRVQPIVMPDAYDERPCPNCSGPKYTKAGPGCDYFDLEEYEKCVDGMIKQA